ncbi:MAG: ATP-binding protein [Candidatus Latescibacteria bacterium]|nr:ATP-binding protein [Candidatus Latescibacterota bacterium]
METQPQDDVTPDGPPGAQGARRTSLDQEAALRALADLTLQVIGSDACGILRVAEGEETPELLTAQDTPASFRQAVQRLCSSGRIEKALVSSNPTVISESDAKSKGRTFVISPMVAENRPVGVFVVCCDRAENAYTEDDLERVGVLARQATIALENARLYRNLTETHQKLKASQAQLVQSGKMAAVGQLAAGVAHEVNNPLQIILSRVQLLMMRHREEGGLSRDLHLIESNVKRISRIIRSLLDFARHNTGDEEWRRVDLYYLVTQTFNLMQHVMEKGGIEVDISVSEGDPPSIRGNVGEIEQVFLNLLLNAHQAMPDGGRIDIELGSDGDEVIARMRDTGEGIPHSNLSRVFDPFFTTREEEGGSGLGLSIIYGIVQNHNGKIDVESQLEVGTTFRIQFPAYREGEGA